MAENCLIMLPPTTLIIQHDPTREHISRAHRTRAPTHKQTQTNKSKQIKTNSNKTQTNSKKMATVKTTSKTNASKAGASKKRTYEAQGGVEKKAKTGEKIQIKFSNGPYSCDEVTVERKILAKITVKKDFPADAYDDSRLCKQLLKSIVASVGTVNALQRMISSYQLPELKKGTAQVQHSDISDLYTEYGNDKCQIRFVLKMLHQFDSDEKYYEEIIVRQREKEAFITRIQSIGELFSLPHTYGKAMLKLKGSEHFRVEDDVYYKVTGKFEVVGVEETHGEVMHFEDVDDPRLLCDPLPSEKFVFAYKLKNRHNEKVPVSEERFVQFAEDFNDHIYDDSDIRETLSYVKGWRERWAERYGKWQYKNFYTSGRDPNPDYEHLNLSQEIPDVCLFRETKDYEFVRRINF